METCAMTVVWVDRVTLEDDYQVLSAVQSIHQMTSDHSNNRHDTGPMSFTMSKAKYQRLRILRFHISFQPFQGFFPT